MRRRRREESVESRRNKRQIQFQQRRIPIEVNKPSKAMKALLTIEVQNNNKHPLRSNLTMTTEIANGILEFNVLNNNELCKGSQSSIQNSCSLSLIMLIQTSC